MIRSVRDAPCQGSVFGSCPFPYSMRWHVSLALVQGRCHHTPTKAGMRHGSGWEAQRDARVSISVHAGFRALSLLDHE